MFKNVLKNKAFKISGLVLGILIVIAAAVYFFVLPGKQANDYITSTKEKQQQLNSAMNEVAKILESDTFVDAEVTNSQMVSDASAGLRAVESAEKIHKEVNADLVNYNPLPLTDWNNSQKKAIELRDKEKKYSENMSKLMTEARGILSYINDFSKINQAVQEGFNFPEISEDASTEDIANIYQKIVDEARPYFEDLKKMNAPNDLKEIHNAEVEYARIAIEDTELMIQAIRDLNIDEITRLENKMDTDFANREMKFDAQISKVIRDSEFSRSVLNLQDLNNSL